ncbi:MAG: DnaJ domain-containing protein [Deltaproteobacteria bacterium]
MLVVETKVYEKVILQIINAEDMRKLVKEFLKDRFFFYSVVRDISKGEFSPNYHIIAKVAREKKIDEQFILDQARFVLSYFNLDEGGDDHYKTLNIPRDASPEEIRKNWLELMKAYHPDKIGDRGLDITKKLNEAYAVLGDAKKRRAYNMRYLPEEEVIVREGRRKPNYLIYGAAGAATLGALALGFILLSSPQDYEIKDAEYARRFQSGEGSNFKPRLNLPSPTPLEPLKEPIAAQTPEGFAKIPESPPAPAFAPPDKSPSTKAKEDESIASALIAESRKGGKNIYIVQKGDNLWKIARALNTTTKAISEANTLSGRRLNIGDALVIPQAAERDTQIAKAEPTPDSAQKTEKAEKTPDNILTPTPQSPAPNEKAQKSPPPRSSSKIAAASAPDTNSLYSFVSDYASAYQRRDINRFLSYFEPDARENGSPISQTMNSYSDNFYYLEIKKYDIFVRQIKIADLRGYVEGDFVVNYRKIDESKVKTSRGTISWVLLWQDNMWRIKELNYKLRDTKSINE